MTLKNQIDEYILIWELKTTELCFGWMWWSLFQSAVLRIKWDGNECAQLKAKCQWMIILNLVQCLAQDHTVQSLLIQGGAGSRATLKLKALVLFSESKDPSYLKSVSF